MKLYHMTRSETEICMTYTLVLELASFPLTTVLKKNNLLPTKALRFAFARKFMKDMVTALRCMHERGIVHRDLKPDNVLLGNSVTETDLEQGTYTHLHFLLCDLGLSKQQEGSNMHVTTMRVGTIKYMAPEIELWNGESKDLNLKPSDIWSLGIMLFEVLSGSWISEEVNTEGQLKKLLRGFEFEKSIHPALQKKISEVSQEGYDILSKMMLADYTRRISLADIERHPFMADL